MRIHKDYFVSSVIVSHWSGTNLLSVTPEGLAEFGHRHCTNGFIPTERGDLYVPAFLYWAGLHSPSIDFSVRMGVVYRFVMLPWELESVKMLSRDVRSGRLDPGVQSIRDHVRKIVSNS